MDKSCNNKKYGSTCRSTTDSSTARLRHRYTTWYFAVKGLDNVMARSRTLVSLYYLWSFSGYLLLVFFFFLFLFVFSFFLYRFFPLSMYLGCWRPYVVPVVSSTMAWHCIIYSLYSKYYDVVSLCRIFVTTELVSLRYEGSARNRGVLDVDG